MPILNVIGQSSRSEKHYENSNTSRPSGWNGVANVLQEIDREKNMDCKEDIDTLLVFAGLFSAVMTAFIIESYQLLSEDLTQVTVQVLKDIRAELNSLRAGANSTNTLAPPLDDPFQPSTAAIQVNVLWFASLIISLATVSFGILVKQWLREYLAMDTTYPLARVRIRHFRHPGLATWKVYEIAAILPFLLQVSLGLFFLGLCIFTWNIHRSVGYASCTLVLGWLTFFCLTTIAPLVSSRCPYKTTFLKRALVYIRNSVRFKAYEWTQASLSKPNAPLSHRFLTALKRARTWGIQCLRRGADRRSLPSLTARISVAMKRVARKVLGVLLYSYSTALSAPVFTEADAMVTRDHDVSILLEVDAVLTDDELLRTTLWEAYQQLGLDDWNFIHFVVRVVEHRIPGTLQSLLHLNQLLDLRGISSPFVDVLKHSLARLLKQMLDMTYSSTFEIPHPRIPGAHIISIAQIICARSQRPVPQEYIILLCRILPLYSDRERNVVVSLMDKCYCNWKAGLDPSLSDLVHSIIDDNEHNQVVNYYLGHAGVPGQIPSSAELLALAQTILIPDYPVFTVRAYFLFDLLVYCPAIDADCSNTIIDLLGRGLTKLSLGPYMQKTRQEALQRLFSSYLYLIVWAGQSISRYKEAGSVFVAFLRDQRCTRITLQVLQDYSYRYQSNHYDMIAPLWVDVGDAIGESLCRSSEKDEISDEILGNIHRLLDRNSLPPLNLANLCLTLTRAACGMTWTHRTHPFDPVCYSLSCSLASSLREQPLSNEDREALRHCLDNIDIISRIVNVDRVYHQASDELYPNWLAAFNAKETFYCDELVEVLMDKCNILDQEDGSVGRFYRVRRILDLRANKRVEAFLDLPFCDDDLVGETVGNVSTNPGR